MCRKCRCSLFCIMPPHLLKHMAQSEDARIRRVGLEHLAIASRISTRRSLIGLGPASASTGQLKRTVFDAKHTPDYAPTGPMLRGEDDGPVADRAAGQRAAAAVAEAAKGRSTDPEAHRLFLQARHDRCLNCNECSIARSCPADAYRRVPVATPYILKGQT